MNHINNFIRSFHALLNVLWEMQQCSLLCVQCLQHLKAFLMSCQAWIIRDQEFLINNKKKKMNVIIKMSVVIRLRVLFFQKLECR